MKQLIIGKFLGIFSSLTVIFSDVFFLCVPGPPVCCFKSSPCQRERVLWKPRIPCDRLQPENSQKHRGDVFLPPTWTHWKVSTLGMLPARLRGTFEVVLEETQLTS